MAEEDEVIIRAILEDQMSAGMAKMQAQIGQLRDTVKASNAEQEASTKKVTAAVNAHSSALNQLSRQKSNVDALTTAWGKMASPINQATSAALSFSRVFSESVVGAASLATAGIVAFGLKSAATIQSLQLSLNALTGSQAAGASMFSSLQTLANKTPFTTIQQVQSAQMLLNYGVGQNQILPLEKSLSDITAATPNPTQNLSEISLALGQVAGKGTLRGQEFNQLANAGVPIAKIVSEAYGIPLNQVQQVMQNTDLPADKLIQAITNESGPTLSRLKGFSDLSSQTLGGTFSTFKSELQQGAASALNQPAQDIGKQLPGFGADLNKTMIQAAPGIDHLVSSLLQLADHALPLLGPLLNSVDEGMAKFIDTLIPWLDKEAANGKLTTDMDKLGDAFAKIGPEVGPLVGQIADVSTNLAALGVGSLPVILTPMSDLLTLLNGLAQSGPLGKAAVDGLVLAFAAFKTVSPIVTGIGAISKALDALTVSEVTAGEAGGAASTGLIGGSALATVGKAGIVGAGGYAAYKGISGQNNPGNAALAIGGGAATGAGIGLLGGPFDPISVPVGALAGGIIGGIGYLGAHGDVSSAFAQTITAHQRVSSGLPGMQITSGVRNYGLAGPGSGHASGKAIDVTGPYVRSYIDRVRQSGGFGIMHDVGSGLHGHAQFGDAIAPPSMGGWGDGGGSAAPYIYLHIENVSSNVDLESALDSAMTKWQRQQAERR